MTSGDLATFYRSAFLRYLQTENRCEKTGKPCREPERCGCDLELSEYLEAEGDFRKR